MYPQFFGFEKLPFRLRPDADFLFLCPEYVGARNQVLDALQRGPRVVLLAGAPGVGKTLLLEDVLGEIKGRFTLCRVNQPHLSATELLQALLLQLGAMPADVDAHHARPFAELAASLESSDARNAPPLLIVDDAQLLADTTVRTFGEILDRAPRLKILLAAQSGPQARLADLATRMRAAEQPCLVQLQPLAAETTKPYVERRLAVAGSIKELFTADAYAMIFQHTGGVARLINVLCDAALHAACMRASGHVSAAEILLATQDARWPEAVARDRVRLSGVTLDQPAATAQLFVTHGSKQVAVWPLKPGRISIGRAPDNELRLDANFVSRHHCQVVTVGSVSTIEDLGSVNGMCVNGKTVKLHVLQDQDEITLGQHVLTYRMN